MSNSKNVEAFTRLIGICTGFGGDYSPGSPNLRVDQLTALLGKAHEAMTQVSIAKTAQENATNQRQIAFEAVRKLASRIYASLKSGGVGPLTIDDASTMVRKIKGQVKANRPPIPSEGEITSPVIKYPRSHGLDFGSTIYHFEKLIETVSMDPDYMPGQAELQLENLKATLDTLRSHNAAVVNANVALSKARRDRDLLLYGNEGSVHKACMAVKQEVHSIFGFTTMQAKALRQIRFVKKQI